MKQIIMTTALFASIGVHAAGLPCFIHPQKNTVDADLPALAKVTRADAESTALKAVKVNGASRQR